MKISLGTAAIGRPQYINIKKEQHDEPFNKDEFIKKGEGILTAAYQKGVRHFDTAPGYGIAETILLRWLSKNNIKDVRVSSKWGYTYTANFAPNGTEHEVKEHSLQKLKEQWKFSKQLLPYLNIYQIHSATLDTGVLENGDVLDELFRLKEKYGLQIGLSASGVQQEEVVKKAMGIERNGRPLFTVFQVTYNILEQSLRELINNNSDKLFIIKEAMANGRLLPNKSFPHYKEMYAALEILAQKYHVGPDAIAMRFCAQTVPAEMVLSGAGNAEQLTSNLRAVDFELTFDELQLLDSFKIDSAIYWKERSALTWQ